MKLKFTFLILFAAASFKTFAQQTEKASLNAIAPAFTAASVVSSDSVSAKKEVAKTVVEMPKKVTFSLAAGTMMSNYGMATYLSPSIYYRLNSKWSVFSSVTYLNTNFTPSHTESLQPMAAKNYLLNVGGTYDVSDKLRLSGSIWRDFSGSVNNLNSNANFRQPARYGTEFNARYKLNENFSVYGSIRTSNGNSYNSYNSYFSPSPLGF